MEKSFKKVGPTGPESLSAGNEHIQRALAIGIELSKRAVRAQNLEDLQFILVNDCRALIDFDRSSLITHFEGKSALNATNNQPTLEKKSKFVQEMNKLAPRLKHVRQAIVAPKTDQYIEGVSKDASEAINEYMVYAGCSFLVVIPFAVHDQTIAHLVMEFFDNRAPAQEPLLTLLNMTPFLALALVEKRVISGDQRTRLAFEKALTVDGAIQEKSRSRFKIAIIIVALAVLGTALTMPVTLVVGGRAELTPYHEYAAFVQMDGIVDKVLVREGDSVKKEQTLAELDPRETDYRIREARRLLESYRTESSILRNLGAENPMKLAESQLIAIKALRAQQEVDFLNWQSRYLTVSSPVDGVILTRKVESLVGRKFKAGEPFCRIAPHDALLVDVFVRESDVNFVQSGAKGNVFLNYRPETAYPIQVKSVAPKSESVAGLGGVFRARAELLQSPPGAKPGMLGIAHIDTEKTSLFYVLTRRMRIKLNEMGLMF